MSILFGEVEEFLIEQIATSHLDYIYWYIYIYIYDIYIVYRESQYLLFRLC